MNSNNADGSVRVVIEGDYSKLPADFAQANRIASQAGASVASAFGSGARSQINLATQDFKKFWTAADGVNLKLTETDLGVKKLSQGTKDLFAKVEALNQNLKDSKSVLAEVQEAFKSGAASAQDLARAEQEVANAARATQGEVQSVVGLIPGLGRAAEHFINIVPGLGTAILAAFPVLGFIALAQSVVQIGGSISSAMDKMTGLEEAEKNLQRENKKTEESFTSMIQAIDRLNVSGIGRDFGAAAGQRAEAISLRMQIADAQRDIRVSQQKIQSLATVAGSVVNNPILLVPKYGKDFAKATEDNIKAEGEKIVQLQNKILSDQKALEEKNKDAAKAQATEMAALSLAGVNNEIAALDRASEAKRKLVEDAAERQRSIVKQNADLFQNAATRASIIADGEVDIASRRSAALRAIEEDDLKRREALTRREASLESAGQTPNAIAVIQTAAAGKVAAMREATAAKEKAVEDSVAVVTEKALEDRIILHREYEKEIAALAEAGRKAEVHVQEEIDKELKTTNRTIADSVKRLAASGKEIRRVNEREARTQGLAAAHDVTMGRLQSERDYGLAVSHTASQQIAYAREIARFDREKIQAELDAAKASRDALDPVEDSLRIESENYRIQKLEDDLAEKQFSDDTKLLRLQKDLSIQGQIQLAIIQAEARAINDIANGIADVVVDHKGIGATFKNIGKQLEKTIIAAVASALLTAAKDKIFEELAKVLPKTGIIGKIAQALGIGAEDPVKQQIAAIKAQTEATHKQTAETVKSVAAEGGLKTATVDLTGAVRDLIREMAACCACSCESHGKEKPNSSSSESPSAPGWSESGGGGGFGPYTTSGFDPIYNPGGNEDGNDPYGNFYSNGGVYDTPAVYNNPPTPPKEVVTTTITYGNVSKSMPGPPSVAMDAPPSGMADQISSAASASPNYSAGGGTGDMHFHAHGMTDPDKFIRVVAQKLPAMLKARSPVFSPLSQGAR